MDILKENADTNGQVVLLHGQSQVAVHRGAEAHTSIKKKETTIQNSYFYNSLLYIYIYISSSSSPSRSPSHSHHKKTFIFW